MEETASQKTQGTAKRRLGRGLSALLGERTSHDPAESQQPPSQLVEVDVTAIDRNPFQPRKDFSKESLQDLADSIRQHGVLQPLLVRPNGGRYQLIAGERRWLAAQQAGLQSVPCRILELEDQRVSEAAFEENLKRKDLNPLEKAHAFQDYLERFGCPIEVLAKRLSMQRSTVSNFLRLLELPDSVKQSLCADKITNGHARALLPLEAADQVALCQRIQSESLSVRATENAVRELLQDRSEGTIPFPAATDTAATEKSATEKSAGSNVTNHVRSLEQQLREFLGAKVDIKVSGKESGRIIISFHSNDEFERIVRQLRRAA